VRLMGRSFRFSITPPTFDSTKSTTLKLVT